MSSGSLANLTCIVRGAPATPSRVFWYKDGAVLGLVGQNITPLPFCHEKVLLWPGHQCGENDETKHGCLLASHTKLQLSWPGDDSLTQMMLVNLDTVQNTFVCPEFFAPLFVQDIYVCLEIFLKTYVCLYDSISQFIFFSMFAGHLCLSKNV